MGNLKKHLICQQTKLSVKKSKLYYLQMPTITTEGVVIRRSNFGEADRILTVLTPFRGKMKVVAKGVRRITSRRAGNVELLNNVKLHIFVGIGMPILTEAESLNTYPKIKSDLILSSYGSYIAELVERLTGENQPSPEVYKLVVDILNLLESNPRQIFIRAFEVKLLNYLGFWSLNNIQADTKSKNLLSQLQHRGWHDIDFLKSNNQQAMDIERILRYYIERILESPVKSVQVINQFKRNLL